jgi:uncharacterized protein (TIGR03435 family)
VIKQVVRKLDFSRELLLSAVGLFAMAVPIAFGLLQATQVRAQSPAEQAGTASQNGANDIAGTWQGTLQAGRDLRTVLKITKTEGVYKAVLYSIDQGPGGMPSSAATFQAPSLKFSILAIDGSYEGKLSADGSSISGTWTQGGHALPLNLKRATPQTAWVIPEPPPRLPPMAADANPAFEVATIKPSKPDVPGKGFRVNGRHFSTMNTSLSDLITFSYGLHPRQIAGAPAWLESDKYDIEAQPDGEGAPNDKQWKTMLQKLVADRFKLTFHHDQKELSVYALVVGKNGPKLTKSEGDPNGLPGLFFSGPGRLSSRNASMGDFASLMQGAVLDRPVVDQTELKGRFDFPLNWTPDETQFAGFGMKTPPPADPANAPPGLFTAIQEQLGLKLEATKASVDVLVIDHVEKPSEN